MNIILFTRSILSAERTKSLLFTLTRKEAKESSPVSHCLGQCCSRLQSPAELTVRERHWRSRTAQTVLGWVDCNTRQHCRQVAIQGRSGLRAGGVWGIWSDQRKRLFSVWNSSRGLVRCKQQKEWQRTGPYGPFRSDHTRKNRFPDVVKAPQRFLPSFWLQKDGRLVLRKKNKDIRRYGV